MLNFLLLLYSWTKRGMCWGFSASLMSIPMLLLFSVIIYANCNPGKKNVGHSASDNQLPALHKQRNCFCACHYI